MRGSPHVYSLLWLENTPDMQGNENKTQIVELLDRLISVQIPDKNNDPDLHSKVVSKPPYTIMPKKEIKMSLWISKTSSEPNHFNSLR